MLFMLLCFMSAATAAASPQQTRMSVAKRQNPNCRDVLPVVMPFGGVPLAPETAFPPHPTAFGVKMVVGNQPMAFYIKSWSFFRGRINANDDKSLVSQPGSLILGGYDKNKVGGRFAAFDIGGVGSSDFQFPQAIFERLKTPLDRTWSLPEILLLHNKSGENFNPIFPPRVAGVLMEDYDAAYLETYSSPLGNSPLRLSLDIQGSKGEYLVVDIPYHQLLQPRYTTDTEDGSIIRDSESSPFVFTISPQNTDDKVLPIFGLPFLSSAYLTVNYDNSTFSLAPVATPIADETIPVPIKDTSCLSLPPVVSITGVSDPDLLKYTPGIQSKPPGMHKSIKALLIAGPLVGVALALLCGYLVWRRVRKHDLQELPDIPLGDCPVTHESGGEPIHQADGHEVFQADSNAIHHIGDDFGSRVQPNLSRNTVDSDEGRREAQIDDILMPDTEASRARISTESA
ncbi:hypothetical protein Dda_8606 [Drechslerella dactyloides]|uniref:Peptidase A1 domain-containing protein n=1 Tax=Drechslerella dactyloides TaxID=74499 RepID=A0AAD6IQQ6_DREDA|nr:hypothetical protein Dda_8606 [Drechslerella dactyloides]